MAVKEVKDPDPKNPFDLDEDQLDTLEDIRQSRALARELFKTKAPTLDMIAGVAERVMIYEKEKDQKEAFEQLVLSVGIARTEFEVDEASSEMVFFMYDFLFGEEE